MNASDYPVILAVEDFVPTFVALAGFWLLGNLAGYRLPGIGPMGAIGAVLIGAGGFAKSLWKFIIAAFGYDLPWLENALFPPMAAGAMMLLWALGSLLRGRVIPWWPFAAVFVAVGVTGLNSSSMKPVFILATSAVTAVSVVGAILAARQRAWVPVVLYAVGIAGVMALVPIRSHPEHETLAMQWIQQGTNTAAQGVFLVAALMTVRAVRAAYGGADYDDALGADGAVPVGRWDEGARA